MKSSAVIKFSAPVARSSLLFISVGLLATSIATIYYAVEYPYLFGNEDNFQEFYVQQSKTIPIVFTILSIGGILVALSTFYASYRGKAGYTLGHAGFIGIFVPAVIAAYFLTRSSRHNPNDFVDEGFYRNYRIDNVTNPETYRPTDEPHKIFKMKIQNIIDLLQENFKCCGFHGFTDWNIYSDFIPASCCELASWRDSVLAKDKIEWAKKWPGLDENFKIEYCDPTKTTLKELQSCREAFIQFEDSKNTILALLTSLLGILCIADAVLSLLTYALDHIEHECKFEETELTEMSSDGQLEQIQTINIKPRSSISSNSAVTNEAIAARAMAVRFNLSNSPRQSFSGPSKFSLAARRQSSYI